MAQKVCDQQKREHGITANDAKAQGQELNFLEDHQIKTHNSQPTSSFNSKMTHPI